METCRYGHDNCKQRCTAKAKWRGERCAEHENPEAAGSGVCRFHGGKAPQVIAAAKNRWLEYMEDITHVQLSIIRDAGAKDADRLAAINSVLDRAGLPKTTVTEVDVGVLADDPEKLAELWVKYPEAMAAAAALVEAQMADG